MTVCEEMKSSMKKDKKKPEWKIFSEGEVPLVLDELTVWSGRDFYQADSVCQTQKTGTLTYIDRKSTILSAEWKLDAHTLYI